MKTVEELAERFLNRFAELQPTVYRQEGEALICSLKLHSVFREIRLPVVVVLGTYASMEMAFKDQPEWLDNHISELIPGEGERSELILFVLGAGGSEARAKRFLANQVLAINQPLIPTTALYVAKKNAIDSIRDAIVQYVPTRYFSPYRIDKVAAQKMFIGRKHLLNKLRSAGGSQIIVGPRRIGKSSLVRHFGNALGNVSRFIDNKEPMPRCSYVDVSGLGSDASSRIWNSILREFKLQRKDFAAGGRIVKLAGATRKEDRAAPVDEAQALTNLIKGLPGQLTIILDEVDKWIESERPDGWSTLDRLRAMSDEGKAQVLLVGYESLALAADNDRFPFAGRGSKLHLGPLDLSDVDQLVTEPMAEMGLRFEGKDQIINLIWSTTSGMPHIVQDVCAHIVDQAFPGKGGRVVTMAMLKTAIDSARTVKTFRQPFVDCYFPLAEAIAGMISIARGRAETSPPKRRAPETKVSLTIKEIVSKLEEEHYKYDSRDFDRALAYLDLRFVLESTDPARTRWKWTNDIARETMRDRIENTGQQRWLQNLLVRHREGIWRDRYQAMEGTAS